MYKVGNSALRTYTIGNWLLDVKRTNHSISWKEVWKSAEFLQFFSKLTKFRFFLMKKRNKIKGNFYSGLHVIYMIRLCMYLNYEFSILGLAIGETCRLAMITVEVYILIFITGNILNEFYCAKFAYYEPWHVSFLNDESYHRWSRNVTYRPL